MPDTDQQQTGPQTLGVAETVVLVGRYMRTILNEHGDPKLWEIAETLGWTVEQLQEFREQYADMLSMDEQISLATPPAPVLPPTDGEMLDPNPNVSDMGSTPTDEEVALAIQNADSKLLKGLKSLGLTNKEAEQAEALQKFNAGHFADSMDMVSAGVMRTGLKVQGEQDEIQQRLAFVREMIRSKGMEASEVRDNYVKEERMLMMQFLEAGQLLVNIQDTWYKGSAALALIKMRISQGGSMGPMTQRSNKPGFRPNVVDAEEVG